MVATNKSLDQKIEDRLDLLREAVVEASEAARVARKARDYYHGRQGDERAFLEEGSKQVRYTANRIRRGLDHMKARVTDSEPEMSTQGRGAEDWQLGQTWRDLVSWSEDWTGYRYDSVPEVRDKIYDDFYQVGDGVEKVIWDRDEENGMGMVASMRIDPFRLAWDREAKSIQRRDARWMCHFEPVDIEVLEEEFPKLKDIQEDVPELFMEGMDEAQIEGYRVLQRRKESLGITKPKPRAYRIEWWEKRRVKRTLYLLDGKPAEVVYDGERQALTDEQYEAMPEDEQERYEKETYHDYELWTSVIVNRRWAQKDKLSEYDESDQNGKCHGEYPFAFYSNVWDQDQSHYHGEIEYLMDNQDAVNMAVSQWLRAMQTQNAGWLEVEGGAYPNKEMAKFENTARLPGQMIVKHPGTASGKWVSPNPISAQVFQAGISFLQQQGDDESGYQNVNRGVAERDLSGKAVRALQSDGDLLSVNQRLHLESGLRQATLLRIALLQKFMRGSRMVRIVPSAGQTDREPYNLYTGPTAGAVQSRFNLRPETKPGDGDAQVKTGRYLDRDGTPGEVLEISDEGIRRFDLKLELASGRDDSQADREQMVQMLLQYRGPGGGIELMKWAGTVLKVPNQDRFEEALDAGDAQGKIVQQLEQIKQTTGMGIQELAMVAQQLAAAQQGGAQGAPASQPGPQGPQPGPQG